jgi:hypothetical protein
MNQDLSFPLQGSTAGPTLETALRGLKGWFQPSYKGVEALFADLRMFTPIFQAIGELRCPTDGAYPLDLRVLDTCDITKMTLMEMSETIARSEWDRPAIAILSRLFPIQEDWMVEQIMERGDELDYLPEIFIEALSYFGNNTWDDFYELIDDPGEVITNPDQHCLDFFILYLDQSVDRENFEVGAKHFGWPTKTFGLIHNHPGCSFSRDLLEARLKEAGMDEYLQALDVIIGCTGNIFLDMNMDALNNSCEFMPEFSIENIVRLARDYREALKGRELVERLNREVLADREILVRILKIWDSCFVPEGKKGKHAKPRSVVEILSQKIPGEESEDPQEDWIEVDPDQMSFLETLSPVEA